MESEFGFLGWPWLKERILVLAFFFPFKIPFSSDVFLKICSDELVVEKYIQPQFNSYYWNLERCWIIVGSDQIFHWQLTSHLINFLLI